MPMQDLSALVVDDSKVGRLTMMKKLEVLGVKVALAESGEQALDYLTRQRPDIIFMDHMMPEMDGFEATRRIKASPDTRGIPVIIISGNDDADFIQAAQAAGAVDAIAKPPAAGVLEGLLDSLPSWLEEAAAASAVAPPPVLPSVTALVATPYSEQAAQELVSRLVADAVAPLRDEFMAEIGQRLESESAHQREMQAAWGRRLDQQAAEMAELGRGAAGVEALDKRWHAFEERLQHLETETDKPLPDFDALRSNLDQWVNARLAQLQADLLSMTQSLPPRLESLRQEVHSARSAQADQTARFEQWGSRLDTYAEELARVSRDVQSIWSARVEWENLMEQRMEQHIKQRLDALGAAGQASTPAGGGAALQAEVAKLRDRVSDARLREIIQATLDKARPASDAGGHAEVARLQGRVRLLTIATAVGGALLLAMLGMTLWGG